VYALPMRRFAKRRIGRTLTNVGYIRGSLTAVCGSFRQRL
jgi:hypothetical protein